VKAQCLPFRQIPHTTQLFLDFLSWSPSIQPSTPALRVFPNGRKTKQPRCVMTPGGGRGWRTFWKGKTGVGMRRQNFGEHCPATRRRVSACYWATGGLFGGPLFSIFKALSTIKLADEATKAGSDCIPVFWLATSDHDLNEINHVSLLGPDGSLQKFSAATRGLPTLPWDGNV